jgi:hypothetical protein
MRRRGAEAAGFLAILLIAWLAKVEPQQELVPAVVMASPTDRSAIPARLAELEPQAVSPVPQAAAMYVGNTNTHKFHALSCRYAHCPNCVARFTTRQEAIDAGFRPCGNCDP